MLKNIVIMLLAMAVTIGMFIMLGYTPYVFGAYLTAIVIMYYYVTTERIDDTLFKIMVFMSFTAILGWWYVKVKPLEGFYVTPLRYISSRMTARECQDYCQRSRNCKYSYMPLGTSRSGRRTRCWNSYGWNQRIWGKQNQGGDTWRNKNYRAPPPPPPPAPPVDPFYLRYYNIWPNCGNISCGRGSLLSFKQKCTANRRCDGFSWTRGRNSNSSQGSGCLKWGCKPSQEGRRGFGRGSHGYWLKGRKQTLPLVNRYGLRRRYNPPFWRTRTSRGGTRYKLGECEGDCDRNQCLPGLKCFQRNGYEKVPGCRGRGKRGWDYCYNPNKRK